MVTREVCNTPQGFDQGVSAQVTVAILTKFENKVRVHQVWTTVAVCPEAHVTLVHANATHVASVPHAGLNPARRHCNPVASCA